MKLTEEILKLMKEREYAKGVKSIVLSKYYDENFAGLDPEELLSDLDEKERWIRDIERRICNHMETHMSPESLAQGCRRHVDRATGRRDTFEGEAPGRSR